MHVVATKDGIVSISSGYINNHGNRLYPVKITKDYIGRYILIADTIDKTENTVVINNDYIAMSANDAIVIYETLERCLIENNAIMLIYLVNILKLKKSLIV